MLIALYFTFSIILFIPFFLHLKGDVKNLFKKPICLTLLFFIIIHGITPLIQYPQSIYRYINAGEVYTAWAHIYSLFVVLFFVLSMIVFYSLGAKYDAYPMPQLQSMPISGKAYLAVFVILPAAYGIFYYFMNIMSFGLTAYMQDRIGFADRYGGMQLFFSRWIYVAFFVSFAAFLVSRRRDKMMLLWTIVLGLINIAYFGYLGNRNPIFISLLTCVGIYLIITLVPYISLWKMAFSKIGLVILLLGIIVVFMGYIREIKVGIRSSPARAIAVTLNSGFGNHENVLWLVDNEFDLQYGKTYYAGFVNTFPRAFWEGKPLGAGPILKNLVDHGSYVIGKKGISSLTTGYITEAYMNGGLIGVAIVGALAGMFLRFISKLRLRCTGPWTLAMYCYTVFTFGVSMTHNEFSGAYTRWLVDAFPIFIAYLLFESRAEPYYNTNEFEDNYDI